MLKPAIFRLPTDIDDGVRRVAAIRGEAAAVVVREILREGLQRRGIIDRPEIDGLLPPRPMAR